jgi:hypothetical protein
MRALCGAIIAAGALIGFGLTAIGIGTRYANIRDIYPEGHPTWVKFSELDSSLIAILAVLVITLLIGLGIAFMGLAYHHHRRHHEWLREHGRNQG